MADDDLRDRIAEAIRDERDGPFFMDDDEVNALAGAAVAVVAPELERLRADLAEMAACRNSAVRASDRAEAELERTVAQASDHIGDALRRLEQAEAERDALKAAIERAEALAAKYPAIGPAILAALDTPTDRDEGGDGVATLDSRDESGDGS